MGDELRDLSLQLGCIGKTWAGNLDHDNLSTPLREISKEYFKGLEFLNDPLDNIELVATDNNFFTLIESTECLEFGIDTRSQPMWCQSTFKRRILPGRRTYRTQLARRQRQQNNGEFE